MGIDWNTDMGAAPLDGTRILLWLGHPFSRPIITQWHAPWGNWVEDAPDDDSDFYGVGSLVPVAWSHIQAPQD